MSKKFNHNKYYLFSFFHLVLFQHFTPCICFLCLTAYIVFLWTPNTRHVSREVYTGNHTHVKDWYVHCSHIIVWSEVHRWCTILANICSPWGGLFSPYLHTYKPGHSSANWGRFKFSAQVFETQPLNISPQPLNSRISALGGYVYCPI